MKISLINHPQGDHAFSAMILLLAGVFVLALQDSLVKLMSSQTSFWQFQTLRSIFNLCFILLLARINSHMKLIIPKRWKAVFLRASFLTVCMFCFFSGAPYLTLSQMASGLYTYPLFVTILAGPILGEQVGPWRVGALALGFTGAAFALSPWREDFTILQLLPVVAGFFYALNILTLRKACRNESPLALAFAVALIFLGSGIAGIIILSIYTPSQDSIYNLPFIAIGWPELTLLVAGFALLTSILNLTGNICMSRAYQTADASWLAPIDFSYLVFVAIWSRIIFDQWPTKQAALGMTLIALAGAVTAWREHLTRKALRQ